MNEKLRNYLITIFKGEQKWMYHYEVDDDMFGVETDRYLWIKRVLDGDVSIISLLQYFQKNYSKDEKVFIKTIEELI